MLRNYVYVLWLSCFISTNGRNEYSDAKSSTQRNQINHHRDLHGDDESSTERNKINDYNVAKSSTLGNQIPMVHKDAKESTERNQINDYNVAKSSTLGNQIPMVHKDAKESTERNQINEYNVAKPNTLGNQIPMVHKDAKESTERNQINEYNVVKPSILGNHIPMIHKDAKESTERFQINGNFFTDYGYILPHTQKKQIIDDDDVKPSTQRNQMFSLKVLLNGTLEELKKVPRNDVLHALWAMKQISIPLERKLIIWNTIKDNQSARTLSREILEMCGKILIFIPEYDLYNLNITDWNIVDYLGTFDGFSRRKTGIIAYALNNYWGDDILEDSKIINKFKGLICGFSPTRLNTLDSLTFSEISEDVFNHIYACTSRQLKVLLQNAMRMTTYGPPQAWNASDVERIGLVLRALDFDMLSKLRPESLEGISPETISRMSPQYLLQLSNDQVKCLTDESLSAYRAVIRLASSFASMLCKTNKILIISCVMKVIHFN